MTTPALIITIATIVGKLIPVGTDIMQAINSGMADGNLSAEEAEEIGRKIGEAAGPALDVPVKGRDVIHGPALGLIGAGLGRIARQIVLAHRG